MFITNWQKSAANLRERLIQIENLFSPAAYFQMRLIFKIGLFWRGYGMCFHAKFSHD